jgi:putative transposase
VQSNSIVEVANKILKYQFLYQSDIETMESLVEMLPVMLESYNNRPNHGLYRLTPNEVLEGPLPEKKWYHTLIVTAQNA